MPVDTWANRLENQIMEITKYLQWVGTVLNQQTEDSDFNKTGQALAKRLRGELESKENELRMHKQRNKRLGIKY